MAVRCCPTPPQSCRGSSELWRVTVGVVEDPAEYPTGASMEVPRLGPMVRTLEGGFLFWAIFFSSGSASLARGIPQFLVRLQAFVCRFRFSVRTSNGMVGSTAASKVLQSSIFVSTVLTHSCDWLTRLGGIRRVW